MKLRLWFTEFFLFGHDPYFFQPNGEKKEEERQRELAMKAHREATSKMFTLSRKMDELTVLACEGGNGKHA